MKATRLLAIVTLACVMGVGTLACAKTAPNLTPVGQHAYTADQVVVRVNELQNAAIAAEAAGQLPTATTRIIVQFAVAANQTLRTVPQGWPQTLAQAWASTKTQVGVVANPVVATAIGVVDVIIAGVQ